MKNWRAMAAAIGLDLPARDIDRIAQPLDGLEEAFRPLVRDLTPDQEPLYIVQVEEAE
ncbi:MAG TPA: hypothetical protein VG456_26480 [Candidatus Sulfopaludibacter sp.]|nr:hypothetical protein [Candidatus Sulfopaludibacter sp.]